MTYLTTAHNSQLMPSLRPRKARGADRFWPVLRDLIDAREIFGLRRPVLATLRALISFVEDGTVVFASNRSIIARAEGISESALRRHIRVLIDHGLLRRQDSSNGKRYRLQTTDRDDLAFGLDLAPMEDASLRISQAAEVARERDRLTRYLRKKLGQLIYLARAKGHPDECIEPYQKALRQKLSPDDYQALCHALENATCRTIAAQMAASDSQNGCHKNIPEERILIIEANSTTEDTNPGRGTVLTKDAPDNETEAPFISKPTAAQTILLEKAKELTPDALSLAPKPVKTWEELEALAWSLAAWCGITPRMLGQAISETGSQLTAMAVLTVTQNAGRIRNPSAYFHALTLGARQRRFARPFQRII